MPTARKNAAHKHFRLDSGKIRHAQKVLKAKTETETIERALDAVIAEDKRSRLALAANKRFLRSGISIKDVYSKLAD